MDRFFAYAITVIIHPLFDFIFQGNRVALRKKGLNKEMLEHVFLHQLVLLVPFILYFKISTNLVLVVIFYLASHIAFDNFRLWLDKKLKTGYLGKEGFWIAIGIDQFLHMLALFLIFWLF